MKYTLTSPSFEDGAEIPKKHTCDGENISPELVWSNPPVDTYSFSLLVNNYERTSGMWNHWLIYNIPKNISKLKEGVLALPESSKLGVNSWKVKSYSGPCPPEDAEHKYYFKLYALNTMLSLHHRASSTNIEKVIHQHILDTAILTGTYKRKTRAKQSIAKEKMDLKDATTILRRKDVNQDIKAKAIKEIEKLSLPERHGKS